MEDITGNSLSVDESYKNNSIFELIENHSKIAIVKIDSQMRAEYVSPSMLDVLEYPPQDFIGHSVLNVVHEHDRQILENEIADTIRTRKNIFESEYRVRTKTNKILWMETKARLFYDQQGEFDGAVYIQSDVTDRKLKEQQLRSTLKEKDYLMKELNHRVKNNLAMVSSLISLKESEIENDLSDLKHRIDAIKLVHEQLQNNDIEQIEAKEYFQELLNSVFSSTFGRPVDVVNKIEEMSIPAKTAIPLGLIVNEIATNAIKHGFISDKECRFTIEMKRNSEKNLYVLTLSNTGNPFPEAIELEVPETMGLQLVSILVRQLEGTIELQKSPTPVFTIRFPEIM